jgi:hypothetical protein
LTEEYGTTNERSAYVSVFMEENWKEDMKLYEASSHGGGGTNVEEKRKEDFSVLKVRTPARYLLSSDDSER